MKHAEQIRMMFLCSLNGMRSINFCYLQVKDVYTETLKVKDAICSQMRLKMQECDSKLIPSKKSLTFFVRLFLLSKIKKIKISKIKTRVVREE